jgi:hypothetical protein
MEIKYLIDYPSIKFEGIAEDPKAMFAEYSDKISALFELRSSIKHMRNVDMTFCNP